MDNEKKNSIFSQRHKADCIPCRLVSGFGVIGIGIYLYSQAKYRPSKGGRFVLYTLAAGRENELQIFLAKSK